MVALTLALVDLVGCVYLYGYQINSITYIGVVMAAGIIMDLTVHGPHYFAWLTVRAHVITLTCFRSTSDDSQILLDKHAMLCSCVMRTASLCILSMQYECTLCKVRTSSAQTTSGTMSSVPVHSSVTVITQ
jgi:hypothetical protein